MGHTKSRKKSKIVRHKQGNKHIKACKAAKKGYYQPSKDFTQIHHIVCLSSMTNATIDGLVKDKGKMEFIRECLKLTKWNINDASNTVGLPLKRAFVKKAAAAAEWNGWPCHQVEHNPQYTKAVSQRLYDIVWYEVLLNRTKCKDCQKECNINAASVEEELNGESEYWLEFLEERGHEEEGTAFCWKNRLKPKVEDVWYIPFSMAPKPKARKPPKDWEDLGGTLRHYLSKLMFS